LIERRRREGLEVVSELAVPAGNDVGLTPELETTVYRIVQEALTNVSKHARATSAGVMIDVGDREVLVEVRDDGQGFDTTDKKDGFGLTGLAERVYLAGGTLELDSGEQGTRVRALLPARRTPGQLPSDADQLAS
jgi:signal transduction histidine kinase